MSTIDWSGLFPQCSGNHWTVPVAFALASLVSFWLGYWGGKNDH
jgi:hypothetical protein